MLRARETVLASVRASLLTNSALVTAIGHTESNNKFTADDVNFDTPTPFLTIVLPRGGLENTDPYIAFDVPVMIKVCGQDLRQLYVIYSLVENHVTNLQLPNYNDWKYYTKVRLLDAGFYEKFKKGQQDFFTLGCTIRLRAFKLGD